MLVYACSSNPGKLREFKLAASDLGSTQLSLEPFPQLSNVPAPEETGNTFEENASQKALYYSGFSGEVVLADDSGLEVESLHGAPGVRSARYAGVTATDKANRELLLLNMQGKANRDCQFVCSIALAKKGRVLQVFRGVSKGRLLESPRGDHGFGYDSLFLYPPLGCTFAELDDAQKFSVSHRGSALRKVVSWLDKRAAAID